MSLRYALRVPAFYFSLEQMQKTTLPEAVDWCRNHKGAAKYPFFIIRTDPLFWKNIKVNSDTVPLDIEVTITNVSLEEIHPGIYRTKKTASKEQPQDPRTEILEHLRKMEEQHLPNEETEKKTLEYIGSRENMKQLSGFVYKEHLNFSAMNNAAKTVHGFPAGWNLQSLPGELTELLKDTTPIYGVSTSNCCAGELGTWGVAHVENGDLLSASFLFEFSAGKAWTGFNPDEEKKINPFLAKGPRKQCISPMLHVDIMFDNEVYHEKSMQWYYCIQRPGDYVITNPMGVHQVHNLGFNFAETINFISHDYRKFARRRKACQCLGRLSLYKDFEQWNILADYVYSGEYEFLNATYATANLSADELREMCRTSIAKSKDESEIDIGDVINETPMESVKNVINEVLNDIATTQHEERYVDLLADDDEIISQSELLERESLKQEPLEQEPLKENEPVVKNELLKQEPLKQEPLEQEPLKENEPVVQIHTARRNSSPRALQQTRDDAIISAAQNAKKDTKYATQREKKADARPDRYSQRKNSQSHPRERSPRCRADQIRQNKNIADRYKESRKNARNAYEERTPGRNEYRIRESGPVSIWFKRKIENCNRAVANARTRIKEYKTTGKWFRNINFSERMDTANSTIQILNRRRQLFNALVKMYHNTPEILQARIAEGYYEKEVIRDFILYHDGSHRTLLTAALESLNADMEYWNKVFSSEELWNEEFGVDSDYRIPSLDWCTRNF